MEYKYERPLVRIGNSVCIVLPKPWLEYYNAAAGDKVEMITRENQCMVTILSINKQKEKGGK